MDNQTNPDFLTNQSYNRSRDLDTRNRIQERHSTHPRNWFHWVFDLLDFNDGSRILELGCGPGDLWERNADRLPENWRYFLSDLSFGMAAEARRRLENHTDRFRFLLLDSERLAFPSESFDTVLAIGVLDHLPDRRAGLQEIRRVLKPGGCFYTATGGRTHLQELESLVQPFLPDASYGGDPNRFGLENGAALLSPWFTDIQRSVYEDELVFEQPEPILAYVRSEAETRQELAGERLQAFTDFIRHELAVQGVIRVTCQKGVFAARRSAENLQQGSSG